MSIANIAWTPSSKLIEQSNMASFLRFCGKADYASLLKSADADYKWFWSQVLAYFDFPFDHPFDQLVDTADGPEHARWCVGGSFNVTKACLDAHRGDKDAIAIIASSEDGARDQWSNDRLFDAVARFAAVLESLGIRKGDRVAIYMPMVPEAVVAFLGAARIGAITVPLFSGFGADALAQRLEHSGAKLVVTTDVMHRRGKAIATLPALEEALEQAKSNAQIIVHGEAPAAPHISWDAIVATVAPRYDAVSVEADAPLLLVYTSGTTGAPKGAILTHIGFAAKTALDLQLCLDLKPSDRWLWMSDFGWIIGPVMIGGALIAGATLVLADGAPDYPQPDRMWQVIEDNKVSFLGLAPTLIRGEMAKPGQPIKQRDLSSLRVVVSSGEPWTQAAWQWCFDQVCRQQIPILNWSGGTEISGGILSGIYIQPQKPLAFSSSVPGMGVDVFSPDGDALGTDQIGELVLRTPSIGLTRGLWKDDGRYIESYWSDFKTAWKHGDLVSRDSDGYWSLHGRSDDVLKIGGKRTGPSEIESILVETALVSDAAVIGIADERAGQAIGCFCIRSSDAAQADDALQAALETAIVSGMGKPYKPRFIVFVSDLPKTRSGKVVRRVIAALCKGGQTGDLSSIANPEAIEEIAQIADQI